MLWSLVAGAFLCAVYDLFRITRLRRRQNAVLLFVCDFAFCMVATCVMLLLFFNLSYGRVRGYAFAFAVIGFLTWRFTVSRLVIKLILLALNAAERLLNSVKMRVRRVVLRLMRRIYTACYCFNALNSVKKMKFKRKDIKNVSDEACKD